MKKELFLIIILFIFLVIPKTSAQNISVDYLEKVEIGEEFSFKIKLLNFQEDIYDVKIDIFGNEKRISRILDKGKWKSTFYYINKIIHQDEEKEFLLKIENYTGTGDIIIKIRYSSGDSEKFNGYEIEIAENTEIIEIKDDETEQEEIKETEIETNKDNEIIGETPLGVPQSMELGGKNLEETENFASEEIEKRKPEIIRLNPQVIKTQSDKENSDNKTLRSIILNKNKATYGFIVFCVLLGFLYIIKLKKTCKNEFE